MYVCMYVYIYIYIYIYSVPKPFNKLIHLAKKINKLSIFNKMTL